MERFLFRKTCKEFNVYESNIIHIQYIRYPNKQIFLGDSHVIYANMIKHDDFHDASIICCTIILRLMKKNSIYGNLFIFEPENT